MCVSVSLCVCVSLMGRRWLFGGKPQLDCVAVCFCCTWQQVSPVCRCLRLAACASRSTAFALLLLGELALIEGQGQRAFASAAAHVRLRRRRVESTRQGAVPSCCCCCCTVLQACLCVCVCEYYVYVLCVRTACEVGILAGPVVTKRGVELQQKTRVTIPAQTGNSLPLVYLHMYILVCIVYICT